MNLQQVKHHWAPQVFHAKGRINRIYRHDESGLCLLYAVDEGMYGECV